MTRIPPAGDTSLRIVRVTDQKDLVQLYRFRYRVFVEELGWLAVLHHEVVDLVSLPSGVSPSRPPCGR